MNNKKETRVRLESPLLRRDIPNCHKDWSDPDAPPTLVSPEVIPLPSDPPSAPTPLPPDAPQPRNSNLY
ncbi:hypothetical protein WA026_012993 [Henosepilachna vigintioctopunctata]|uniref:Uncharacterized protein n=1 Tax=Henosepilachna vigintioctopunctata TaxID=420089 RepID=A0AAW1TMX4_9CUCU